MGYTLKAKWRPVVFAVLHKFSHDVTLFVRCRPYCLSNHFSRNTHYYSFQMKTERVLIVNTYLETQKGGTKSKDNNLITEFIYSNSISKSKLKETWKHTSG